MTSMFTRHIAKVTSLTLLRSSVVRTITNTTKLLMPVVNINVPTMGDSITEGTVVDIPSPVGTHLGIDDVVIVLETDKVSVDVRTDVAGIITTIAAELDDVVEVGSPLYSIDTDAGAPADSGEPAKEAAAAPAAAAAAPAAAAAAAPPAPAAPAAAVAAAAAPPSNPGAPSNRTESRQKLSRMRNRVAVRLKESQNVTASLTTFQELDMGPLMDLRAKHKEEFEKVHGVKLGFMSAFVKASTAALQVSVDEDELYETH